MRRAAWAAAAGLLAASAARADFPYPTCADAACADPADFGAYLHLAPGQLPDDFSLADDDTWKYLPDTGMNVTGAWQLTTGRPDVVGAILDSGIRWDRREVARAVWLNQGELPVPPGCARRDCNGDGFVSVDDYAALPDTNGNGFVDGQDLIRAYSDGVDGDGNGAVDDVAGWDFHDGDNDPFDDVDYGHGSGEAADQVSEANDGSGLPGFAPSSRYLPLRVNDSFVAMGAEFTQAVVYATDLGVDYISEALGTLSGGAADQAAIDRAYRLGVPLIASAADEESFHHNLPAALDHTIWVNSIVHGDGTIVVEEDQYDLLNGCTNFGGRAWVAISSNSCSSEATGRAAGLVSLLIAHGKNLMERGLLSPYPGSDRPFSAEEVRQLLRRSADDIDHSAAPELTLFAPLRILLSAPALGIEFGSRHFPDAPGWDLYTGYGRPEATRLLDVSDATLPPEADLSGSLRWFDTIDPERTPKFDVLGSAAAVRVPGKFRWRLEIGCGADPREFRALKKGKSKAPLARARLARWKPASSAKKCGFDPGDPIAAPDAHTVTLRLTVEDKNGNVGEDRRTVAIHSDPSLHRAPLALGASAESSPALADLDGDGALDILLASSDGAVHALRADGSELPGFPALTNPLPAPLSEGFLSGEVPMPREPVVAAVAADDLDGDGRIEIVVAGTEGRVYVFEPDGSRRPGFPVTTDPALSDPAQRDFLNDADRGILAAPVLADLDPLPGDGELEILVAALDGHLYAWNHDAAPRAGFPVRVADPAKVAVDPATGRATPLPGVAVKERARKLVSSPAVGDLDGDGELEIVLGSSEEYDDEPGLFVPESNLTETLLDQGGGVGDFELDVQGRIYAVHADGNLHAGGPFRSGWPARVPLLASGLLPTVATGTPGAPVLADLDGGAASELAVAIFGSVGPILLLAPDGSSLLGDEAGVPYVLPNDFPAGGFPNVPATAGSFDAPFFGALGSGAFGDLDGDGQPEYVAPTGGFRKLLDVSGPASQEPGHHQITAFDPRTGELLPAFPRIMDDMQFLSSPAIADVDGDGAAEIVQGSGGYLLRAFAADGSEPAGWPKFTHGWLVASPVPGDVDGDGQLEVIAATREGNLYVWDTPSPAALGSVQWQGFGGDRRNSKNWSADLVTPSRYAARRGGDGAR